MLNSERYKTAAERSEAFYDFCLSFKGCKGCPIKGQCENSLHGPALYWLDLEAEEEKPLPCPFCGCACDVVTAGADQVAVRCLCGYDARPALCIEDAIAAHNHVAKKCREVKG